MSDWSEQHPYQGSPQSFEPPSLLIQKWMITVAGGNLFQPYQAGSAIEQDIITVGNQICSESVQVGLLSAVEHLISLGPKVGKLAAGSDQSLAPYRDFSVARAASLGAVKAVWCLSPNEPGDRVRRLLSVESEELKGYIGFHKREMKQAPAKDQAEFQAGIDLFTARRQEIRRRMNGSWPIPAGQMFQEAAEYLNANFWRSPPKTIIMGEWQLGSAVVHGHSWPAWQTRNVRKEVTDSDPEHSRTTITVEPTHKEFFRAIAVATCMTEIGVHLWNLRAETKS